MSEIKRSNFFVFFFKYNSFIFAPLYLIFIGFIFALTIKYEEESILLQLYLLVFFFLSIISGYASLLLMPLKKVGGKFYGINFLKWRNIDPNEMEVIYTLNSFAIVRIIDRNIFLRYNMISLGPFAQNDYEIFMEILSKKTGSIKSRIIKSSSCYRYVTQYGNYMFLLGALLSIILSLLFEDEFQWEPFVVMPGMFLFMFIIVQIASTKRKVALFTIDDGEIYVKVSKAWIGISKESINVKKQSSYWVEIELEGFKPSKYYIYLNGYRDRIILDIITGKRSLDKEISLG